MSMCGQDEGKGLDHDVDIGTCTITRLSPNPLMDLIHFNIIWQCVALRIEVVGRIPPFNLIIMSSTNILWFVSVLGPNVPNHHWSNSPCMINCDRWRKLTEAQFESVRGAEWAEAFSQAQKAVLLYECHQTLLVQVSNLYDWLICMWWGVWFGR